MCKIFTLFIRLALSYKAWIADRPLCVETGEVNPVSLSCLLDASVINRPSVGWTITEKGRASVTKDSRGMESARVNVCLYSSY